MNPIYKFDAPDFKRADALQNRYRQMYVGGFDHANYEKQLFWPTLQKNLKKDGHYLDAGCGIGGWIFFLNEKGLSTEGIDAHSGAVRAMTEYNPDISVQIASIDAIPHADESFDGVLSIGSLEYAQNTVHESIQELYRVTKKGGFVFLEVPLANVLRRILYIPLKGIEYAFQVALGKTPTFAYHLFGKQEIEQLLRDAGFTIEESMPHDLPDANSHFGLYTNWPILRGSKPYQLNALGKMVKTICNSISPWIASAGVVVVGRKP